MKLGGRNHRRSPPVVCSSRRTSTAENYSCQLERCVGVHICINEQWQQNEIPLVHGVCTQHAQTQLSLQLLRAGPCVAVRPVGIGAPILFAHPHSPEPPRRIRRSSSSRMLELAPTAHPVCPIGVHTNKCLFSTLFTFSVSSYAG
jgi:hypothetical protein